MKRLAQLVALSVGITSIVGMKVSAAQAYTFVQPSFQATSDVLLANRLPNRFRFQVRASRHRRGGFSRGCRGGNQRHRLFPRLLAMTQ